MPGNRWITPLIVSGLLLSITQNSTAGWDCQPSPDDGWVCSGELSPPSKPAQQKTSGPVKTEADLSDVTQPEKPYPILLPETKNSSQQAIPRQTDPSPEVVQSNEKDATAAVKTRATDADSAPQRARTNAASTAAIPPRESKIVPETDALQQTSARAAASADVAKAAGETAPQAEVPAESVPPKPIEPIDSNRRSSEQIPDQEQESITDEAQRAQFSSAASSSTVADNPEDVAETRTTESAAASTDIDRGLNWNQCFPWSTPAPLSFNPAPAQQMLIDADGAVLERAPDQVRLDGNVQVRRADSLLEADSALYQRTAEKLDAEGNIYFEQPGLRLTAAQAHFDLARDQGELEQVAYRLSDQGAQGNAESAWIESSDLSHYKKIDYTTCKPGQNGWLLEAEELDIDKASGVGTARHAKLRFKGVPFIYLPYASFPIDDRRKSGFLFPTVGSSDSRGADIAVPYYFNISPNMDATFTSRIMSKRGMLLGGEFRYLQEQHNGQLKAEILPDDREVGDAKENTRGAASFQTSGHPAPGWAFDVDLNYVSDTDYLDDMGDSLAVTSTRLLERLGQIRYAGSDWSLLGKTQYFQTVDDSIASIDRPYSLLPQLLFDLYKPRQAYGLTYNLRSEYVNFGHSDSDKTTGQRFDLLPSIALPLRKRWGFLKPKVSLRYTSYALEKQVAEADDNPDRLIPTFSMDSGLFFERNTNWFGSAIVQTLEPRLFYLFTPNKDQAELPNFDTSDITLNFTSLFGENRFSGSDKIGDANQITAALTSRILSDTTGAELFRASIGQIFYFRDREVQLTTGAADDENRSSVVAELASDISHKWQLRAAIQWDPHKSDNNVETGSFSMRYKDGNDRVLNAGYNYTRDSVDQTDLSARWPIGNRWNLVGRWTYSQLFDETVQAFAGIEYDNCCWRVRLIGQQLLTDIESEPVNSVLLQFQLKGLGGWGTADDTFLESNIGGYSANR